MGGVEWGEGFGEARFVVVWGSARSRSMAGAFTPTMLTRGDPTLTIPKTLQFEPVSLGFTVYLPKYIFHYCSFIIFGYN